MSSTFAPGSLVCDGQTPCIKGTFVKISSEYEDWDVFKKFKSKVGVLTWRHFSGMWYADFPGEDEYGFLCGPLLFQLQYSSEKEAQESAVALEKERREKDLKNALESEKSKLLVHALEKKAKEVSATTSRLFEQMAIIQDEMRKAEIDISKMENAFTNLTGHANAMDAELRVTKTDFATANTVAEELRTKLGEAEGRIERSVARNKELFAENTKCKEDLSTATAKNTTLALTLSEIEQRFKQIEMENVSFKVQVEKFENEITEANRLHAILQVNFLAARDEAAHFREEHALAAGELKRIEDAAVAGGGMTRAERDALLDKLVKMQDELQFANKLKDEAQQKIDNVMNDEDLFIRLATAKHGQFAGGSGGGGGEYISTIGSMSDNDIDALALKAARADEAERENELMRVKMAEMKEDAHNGKRVPALQAEIQKLQDRLQTQKELSERQKNDTTRIVGDLKRANQEIKALTDQKENIALDLAKTTKLSEKKESTIQELTSRIAELEEQLTMMTGEEATQHARADSLQEFKEKVTAELAEFQNVLAAQNDKNGELDSTILALKKENSQTLQQKRDLESQLKNGRNKAKEFEEKARQLQNEIDLAQRKSAMRVEELQEQLRQTSQVREELKTLRQKSQLDAAEATATIDELTTQNKDVSNALAQVEKNAEAHKKLVRLYYHKIENRITVEPRKVLFKLWHLQTVATMFWNADEDKKARDAMHRKAKAEAHSLRLRLGAAQRLVEEMQRRDKAMVSAERLLAPLQTGNFSRNDDISEPSTGIDLTGGSRHADLPASEIAVRQHNAIVSLKRVGSAGENQSQSTGLLPALSERQQSPRKSDCAVENEESKDSDAELETIERKDPGKVGFFAEATVATSQVKSICKQCLVKAIQIDAFDQRNTRMKEESRKFEEEIKVLSKRNCELQAEVLDLHKKHMNIMGTLHQAEKLVSSVKERRTALDDTISLILQNSATVALMDKERSLPISGPALVVNTSQSAIVTRKAELQAAEIMRNCQDEHRSSKYQDIMKTAIESKEEVDKSIFEQLDHLTGQVTELVSRHDSTAIRRMRKAREAFEQRQALLPSPDKLLKSSKSSIVLALKSAVSSNSQLPAALNSRPKSALH